eukprot:1024784-Prymnesium_polylepis.1
MGVYMVMVPMPVDRLAGSTVAVLEAVVREMVAPENQIRVYSTGGGIDAAYWSCTCHRTGGRGSIPALGHSEALLQMAVLKAHCGLWKKSCRNHRQAQHRNQNC